MSSLADHPVITTRYFFPIDLPLPDATIVPVEGAELACFSSDSGKELTVVHFHGNGEIVADYLPDFPRKLADLGANTFLAEYRGYGGSTGVPMLGKILDDIPAIRNAIDAPDHQLVIFGRSIGSIYAIEFAARYPDVAGLIIESGIADVLERILLRARPHELGASLQELNDEFHRLFDHQQKLSRYPGPSLCLHAEEDHLVDKSHAERNASWAGGDPRLVIFPRGDHNTIFAANHNDYLHEVGEFLNRLCP